MIDGYSLFVILRALFSACNILDPSEIQFLFFRHYFGETLHGLFYTTHTPTHAYGASALFSSEDPRRNQGKRPVRIPSALQMGCTLP